MPKPKLQFPHYHTFAELTTYLKDVAQAYPHLARLDSIGQSYEGRDLWVMTLTNTQTGPDTEKPAYWIDANIHAGEITGGATALWTIEHLVRNYGKKGKDGQEATWLLDRFAIYVAPRLSPDGTEAFLTGDLHVRSSVRPYPFTDDREGLYPHDIDGDGRVLQMRVPDPKGPWRASEKDGRIMRRRRFDEREGQFYQVYTEGLIRDYDGYTVKMAPVKHGLDLNRNFPFEWAPEGQQRGAGPYPASEPETRAIAEFFSTHRNINGVQSYHTYGGVILRPYASKPDDKFPTHDLRVYTLFGDRGTELTGYPNTSVHHGFRYDPKADLHGGMFDWLYDSLGIFAFANELWDVVSAAGIGEKGKDGILKRDFIGWFRTRPEEDDLKLLKFNDENDIGGFEAWRPYDHPQLGPVEIGGWDYRRFWGVAPLKYLPDIAERNARFTLAHAAASPKLNWKVVDVHPHGKDHYRVVAVLENTGFLPTHTTTKALERRAVDPIRVKLGAGEGTQLVSGETVQDLGHLDGSSGTATDAGGSTQERKLEWVLHAKKGGTVTLEAVGQRAGVARAEVRLG